MKRFLAFAVIAAPFAACGCAHSYDQYRSRDVRYVTSDGYEVPQAETRSRTLPRARVIYSSDVQGGYGPGSYGGHGGTVITPQDDGTVIIEGEYHGR
jgi:hypothetical protein